MNSKQWWELVKNNPAKFNDWLIKQYRGEVTAAQRIRLLASKFARTLLQERTLEIIAKQEETHASWVLDLLKARGIVPDTKNAEDRYWKQTLKGIEDFETGCAVGAHAEGMRLERIRAIADDPEAPKDVADTFKRILKDEIFHEKAFRSFSSKKALAATAGNHSLGLQVLGLSA